MAEKMDSLNSPIFKKYFLPGIVFQSMVIAGGYGTGRELAEFFLRFGTLGGLKAMLAISMVMWSLVCAASYEFARMYRAYDYRTFFRELLGKYWFLYEICYNITLLIVLAVAASAAGNILLEIFGLPYYTGVIALMAGVGTLVLKGRETIEKVLAYWSFLLYIVFFIFLVAAYLKFGGAITSAVFRGDIRDGWVWGGLKYAFYNLGIIPVVLFTARHFETRKDAIISGLLSGVIGIFPGLLLYLAMAGQYPAILNEAVPTNHILSLIGSRSLQYLFQLVLFGTLIETGTGYIFGFNERVASAYRDRRQKMPGHITAVLTLIILALGAFIARFGLVDLIAKGYGTISWAFLFVYVIPILTLGVWKLAFRRQINK
jgi:uncharacterized membrane protein YkvI